MIPILLTTIIVILIIITHYYKQKGKIKQNLNFVIKAILIIILLELTVFNINYYRMSYSRVQEIRYEESYINDETTMSSGQKKVTLKDINEKVKSIHVQLKNVKEEKNIEYEIRYSDDTTVNRSLAKKIYNEGVEKTKYTVINLSRRC